MMGYIEDIKVAYDTIKKLIKTNPRYSDYHTDKHNEHKGFNPYCRECALERAEENQIKALNINEF